MQFVLASIISILCSTGQRGKKFVQPIEFLMLLYFAQSFIETIFMKAVNLIVICTESYKYMLLFTTLEQTMLHISLAWVEKRKTHKEYSSISRDKSFTIF